MRLLLTFLGAASVSLLVATVGMSQDGRCGPVVGKWHSKQDAKVNLEILDSACNFTVAVSYKGLIDTSSGKASFHMGRLYIPLRYVNGEEVGHFLVSRDGGRRLSGEGQHSTVSFSVTFEYVQAFGPL